MTRQRRHGRAFGAGLAALLLCGPTACGGSPATGTSEAGAGGAEATATPVGAGGPRSLSELLGPLGARQSPEQLASIARFIRDWEREPYDVAINDTGLSTRAAMLAWLTESPDVSVRVCMFVSGLSQQRGEEPSPAVTMGSIFGMAAYLIEHPGADPNSAEVQVAGLESGLRWYEASLRRGEPRSGVVDELLRRRDSPGGLRAWYHEQGIQCGQPAP